MTEQDLISELHPWNCYNCNHTFYIDPYANLDVERCPYCTSSDIQDTGKAVDYTFAEVRHDE
jgi:predicted Zn-ribbon and HTH transcriptional regulator